MDKIPTSIVGLLSQIFPDRYTQAEIDSLFLFAGAPEPIPDGSKATKVQAWLRQINKLLWLPPAVQGISVLHAHVIDCELLSGLWMQPCQKLLAGMVIRGSGPNLTAGLDRPQFVPGFPNPDLFDRYAHSGRRSLTPPVPASRRRACRADHAVAAGTGSR